MKNFILITLLLFCYWRASGQNYLQLANECFEEGDYECAKEYEKARDRYKIENEPFLLEIN